jgi:uncharacterized membrane protein
MPEPAPAGTASSNRGVMIILSYLWPLALVPLLVEKDDAEVQWHARNGIVFMVAEIAFSIVFEIVTSLIPLGCLFWSVRPLVALVIVAVHIAAIVKGLNGGRLVVPGLSEYASRF